LRSILFVCTANICRSPMAEGVLRSMLAARGLDADAVRVESAGTHDYHAGEPPFAMAIAAAKRRGYDIAGQLARNIGPADFDRFDHILAMDRRNLAHLLAICPTRCKSKVELLLEYGTEHHGSEVEDPYGGPAKGYELALDRIEDGCRGITQVIAGNAWTAGAP
jgi:protein-tyrosine phosphatase